ncbi:MAG: hypothetical protein CMK70_05175 [Pseudohongiella sp.]|nr:hypothetical protein [Pseudohongiella sp.]
MTILDPSRSVSAGLSAAVSARSRHDKDAPYATSDMLALLLSGVLCGLALHWLVWDRHPGGLGLFIWTALASMAVCWLNRRQTRAWRLELGVWALVMVSAAGLAILRTSPAVILPMYLAMLLSLGLVFYKTSGHELAEARLPMLIKTAWRFPAQVALGILPPLDALLRSFRHGNTRVRGILRGLLFAAPLLFVFITLFASADVLINQQLTRLANLLGELTPVTPFISLVLIVLTTGVLSCTLNRKQHDAGATPTDDPPRTSNSWLRLGLEETAVIMGSLAGLFLAFVALQAFYLFGGYEVIAERTGLTLANYARRGFFELLLVAGLTLAVLMSMAATECHQRLFRLFGAILVGCVMIMLVSAVLRLSLYIEYFGMTLSRMMALAMMGWLGTTLLWFAATVLRGSLRHFLSVSLYGAIAVALLFALSNPAARVAQINLHLAQERQVPLDESYLMRLGADALPAYVSFLEANNAPRWAYCGLARNWPVHASSPADDWRDWNRARERARELVRSAADSC